MEENIPSINSIREAFERISDHIHHTPVLSSSSINKILGVDIYFKCENLQKVGAFKFRGATNAVLSLTQQDAKNGVVTHSSGNHAAALALAANMRGIKSFIVMPDNSPGVKKNAVKGYGAEITFCKPTLIDREDTANKIIERTGATFIHPYNNFDIISGQGTAALEFLKEIDYLDIIMAPVGGGGLLSGTAIAAKSLKKGIEVIGAEPANADDAYRSLREGKIIPSINPQTIADGLLTSLGSLTFKAIVNNVDQILTVSEESIIYAMRMIWERMKIIVEPSSAVPLAAIIENPEIFKNKSVGIILSGGNVDLGSLPFI